MRRIQVQFTNKRGMPLTLAPKNPADDFDVRHSITYALEQMCVGEWLSTTIVEFVNGHATRRWPLEFDMDTDALARSIMRDGEIDLTMTQPAAALLVAEC
jgi:hypothetical protein